MKSSLTRKVSKSITNLTYRNEKEMPDVSDFVNCKRAIRAVLTKDSALLKKLIQNTQGIPSLTIERSACIREDACSYALRTENAEALKLLIAEECTPRTRKAMPRPLLVDKTGRWALKSSHQSKKVVTCSSVGLRKLQLKVLNIFFE